MIAKKQLTFNRLGALILIAVALAALILSLRPAAAGNKGDEAKVQLRDANGVVVGEAKFEQQRNGVEVQVKVHGLLAGFHGFHIHTVGACIGPDFVSAGGHFNPAGVNHAHHAGDMPVLLVNADGTGEARLTTASFQVSQLFDADGSALIIHAGPDNFANIPSRYKLDNGAAGPDATTLATGDSGARTACGVIQHDD
jgi:superoxide dismutase, Cu-Zn family